MKLSSTVKGQIIKFVADRLFWQVSYHDKLLENVLSVDHSIVLRCYELPKLIVSHWLEDLKFF